MDEYQFHFDPSLIQRGRVVFDVHNVGHLKHEVVLVEIPPGVPPIEQQLHSKTRRVVSTLVLMKPRGPGDQGTFAVDLLPGRYALLSFVSAADGTSDALKGMAVDFVVH